MKISIYPPHLSLEAYIEAYIIMEMDENETVSDRFPTYTSVMCFDITKKHIQIIGHAENNFSLAFSGAIEQHAVLASAPQKVLQIIFKPHGAYGLFEIGMTDLANAGTDVELIFPDIKDTVAKMEDLYPKDIRCIAVLETYLLQRVKKRVKNNRSLDQIAFACNEIKRHTGDIRIIDLCRTVNMSETQFRLHFAEKVGLSAKVFCQIEKMAHVGVVLKQCKDLDWNALCEKLNYFDQNHFIKNFKGHFGCTPTQFLKNKDTASFINQNNTVLSRAMVI